MATPVYEIRTNERDANGRETGQWSNEIGEGNEFATIAAATAAIQSLRELDADWADGSYRVVEIASGDTVLTVEPGEGLELPTPPAGWSSIEQLADTQAGLAYLADRGLTGDDIPGSIARYETCQPAHPECYALVYADDSVYIRSNADDEVWYDLAEYLADHDLRIEGDSIVAA